MSREAIIAAKRMQEEEEKKNRDRNKIRIKY
jgi:hypothetical protein